MEEVGRWNRYSVIPLTSWVFTGVFEGVSERERKREGETRRGVCHRSLLHVHVSVDERIRVSSLDPDLTDEATFCRLRV